MMRALAHRGIDGHGDWREGSVALGHQMFHITPESLNEALPLHDSARQLTITATARIDNRDELFDALGTPLQDRAGTPDSALVLYAYAKWGERCVERLEGVFAFAIWDAMRRRLLCVTDPMGAVPLYYFCDHEKFVFASEIKGVLGAPGVPRILNEERLLGLALPALYLEDFCATHYTQVRRMPPASTIAVTMRGIEESEYWRPDLNRRLPYRTEDEIFEALRELLFKTVRAYTRSAFPVAATLSGGLNSSAIVSIASQVTADAGHRLKAICAVLPEDAPPGYNDEREYINLFENWPNLELIYDTAPDRGPFDEIAKTVWSADTPIISPHHYQIASNAHLARKHGARVILYGIGGEVGLTSKATGYLAELFLGGNVSNLWREARAQARREGRSLWRLLRSDVVRPLIPHSWLQRIRPTSLEGLPEVKGCPLAAPLLRRLWRQKSDVIERLKFEQRSGFPDHRANQLNVILNLRHFGGVVNAHAGYEHVAHLFPWADRRIVEFCLAAPGSLKMKDGYARGLVRGALADILPPAIRSRTTKSSAVLDIFERYNRQLPAVRASLDAISSEDPVRAVVDVDKLRMLATSELPRTDAAWRESDKLANLWLVPSGVHLIQFLRQFDNFR